MDSIHAGKLQKVKQENSFRLFPPLNKASLEKSGDHERRCCSQQSSRTSQLGNCCYCCSFSRPGSCHSCSSSQSAGHHSCKCHQLRCRHSCLSHCRCWCSGPQFVSSHCHSQGCCLRCSLQGSRCRTVPTILEEEGIETKCGSRGNGTSAPPPAGIYDGPGRHFLDWEIPKDVVASKARPQMPPTPYKGLSPLHRKEKHEWQDRNTVPGMTSLRLNSPYKQRVRDHPCPHADNLKEAFHKYYRKNNPSLYYELITPDRNSPSSKRKPLILTPDRKPPTRSLKAFLSRQKPLVLSPLALPPSRGYPAPPPDLKSLFLKHNEHFRQQKLEPMAGPVFSQSMGGAGWYVVHPDFRMEPKIGPSPG